MCVENPKQFTKKTPLELIQQSQVAEYKGNIQKMVVCLYTCNKLFLKKRKDAIDNSINKHILLRDRFNERCVRHLHGKLQKHC